MFENEKGDWKEVDLEESEERRDPQNEIAVRVDGKTVHWGSVGVLGP